ncbi:MAG: type II toxin-antitoxin system VapB family antitoxin [Myxococcales bacterium]
MRTTLDIDDGLLRAAKQRAAKQGRTLTSLVEEALRERLDAGSAPRRPFKLRLVTKAGWPSGVEVADRAALQDWLDRP